MDSINERSTKIPMSAKQISEIPFLFLKILMATTSKENALNEIKGQL